MSFTRLAGARRGGARGGRAVQRGGAPVLGGRGEGGQHGGEQRQRGEGTRWVHYGHSSERPERPASKNRSANRLLQLLGGLEARGPSADRDRLAGARVLHRPRLSPRGPGGNRADHRGG